MIGAGLQACLAALLVGSVVLLGAIAIVKAFGE